ncbi:MAG: hypothetical protein LC624_02950 [Halobacteriales archaeon]|nr:hypothetical protein [Halobacteriales archaeon]
MGCDVRRAGPGQGRRERRRPHARRGALLVVAGATSNATSNGGDLLTVAFDTQRGDVAWVARYDGPLHDDDGTFGVAIAASPDGSGVAITSGSAGLAAHAEGQGAGVNDVITIVYDAGTGAERWASRFSLGVGWDDGQGLAWAPDASRVFVTGRSIPAVFGTVLEGNDVITLAYGAADGALAWAARYDDSPARSLDPTSTLNDDLGWAIAVSPDGQRVVVAGLSWTQASDWDAVTLAYRAGTGGELLAARQDGGHGEDTGYAVAVTPDGARAYAAGATTSPAFDFDALTVAYALG